MNNLQKSLLLNAIFSGISGITLIVFNKQIAGLFETSNTTVFWAIGIALLYFAGTIIYEITKQGPIAVLWIIIQDFLWVIGSIVLVAINPFEISKAGNSVIAIIAFVVFSMGINQSKALAQVDSSNNKKSKHFKFERIINADKQSVWKAIADVANYDKVAPNIDAVKIISGEGHGMVRSCSHGKNSWTETCSMWIEEKAYSFEVNTSAPDYPYPFKFLKGTWEVQEIDSNTTKVTMLFDFQYKRKYQNWLLHPLLKGRFSKTAVELLDNWQKMLEN
ncbi:type II toxin-antitoxin system RatA family toxin [Fontibacter flavus]|uniref:Type II toxin-antitoxin system RatA family toxin n=1 Tax=Fontibacter flavus TaxID=654838 RepID=A0ABV6FXB5_9BACT